MNELWIDLGKGFLYFQTDKTDLEEAMEEFLSKLDSIGCVHDNFGWEGCELRIGFHDPEVSMYTVNESCGRGAPGDWDNKQKGELEGW